MPTSRPTTPNRSTRDSGGPPARPLRVLAPLLLLVSVVATVEVSSAILLRLTSGSWLGPRDLTRMETAATDRDMAISGSPGDTSGDPASPPSWDVQRALHPFLGYVLARDFRPADRLREGGPDAVEYGFHLGAPGIFLAPEPGTLTVAVTGGSVACAFGLDTARHPELLTPTDARGGAPSIRVVNLALPGYKQPQQLMTLAWLESLGARFDVVLNLDGYNDIALGLTDNLPSGVAPVFPRGWQYLTGDLSPEQVRLAGRVADLQRRRDRLARLFLRPPLRWSLTAGFVWTRLDRAAESRLAAAADALAKASRESTRTAALAGPDRGYPDTDAAYADLAALWMRSSIEMKALAGSMGARYVHALQPNQYVPGSKPMGRAERAVAWRDRSPNRTHVENGYPYLLEKAAALRRAGVEFVDLTMLFRDVEEPLYIDPCCHVNLHGNELIARALAPLVTGGARTARR